LQKLGANNICVEFIKQTYKGTTRHALKIANATHDNPVDILSEGEARIVALAAFLADVTGCDSNNPFIFDDPISSLDQTYEEKTVKRLVELSENRQVIVFTHRLSLLGQLIELTDGKITTECIRKEHWGTGEIGETPLFAACHSRFHDSVPIPSS
jgi:energy-coupling factor transporter ATP-binding protein EcfA2